MSARLQSVTLLVFLIASTWLGAQEAPKQEFWIQRIKGGAPYVPPNKPHTRLSDVKAKHKGQPAWREPSAAVGHRAHALQPAADATDCCGRGGGVIGPGR